MLLVLCWNRQRGKCIIESIYTPSGSVCSEFQMSRPDSKNLKIIQKRDIYKISSIRSCSHNIADALSSYIRRRFNQWLHFVRRKRRYTETEANHELCINVTTGIPLIFQASRISPLTSESRRMWWGACIVWSPLLFPALGTMCPVNYFTQTSVSLCFLTSSLSTCRHHHLTLSGK